MLPIFLRTPNCIYFTFNAALSSCSHSTHACFDFSSLLICDDQLFECFLSKLIFDTLQWLCIFSITFGFLAMIVLNFTSVYVYKCTRRLGFNFVLQGFYLNDCVVRSSFKMILDIEFTTLTVFDDSHQFYAYVNIFFQPNLCEGNCG